MHIGSIFSKQHKKNIYYFYNSSLGTIQWSGFINEIIEIAESSRHNSAVTCQALRVNGGSLEDNNQNQYRGDNNILKTSYQRQNKIIQQKNSDYKPTNYNNNINNIQQNKSIDLDKKELKNLEDAAEYIVNFINIGIRKWNDPHQGLQYVPKDIINKVVAQIEHHSGKNTPFFYWREFIKENKLAYEAVTKEELCGLMGLKNYKSENNTNSNNQIDRQTRSSNITPSKTSMEDGRKLTFFSENNKIEKNKSNIVLLNDEIITQCIGKLPLKDNSAMGMYENKLFALLSEFKNKELPQTIDHNKLFDLMQAMLFYADIYINFKSLHLWRDNFINRLKEMQSNFEQVSGIDSKVAILKQTFEVAAKELKKTLDITPNSTEDNYLDKVLIHFGTCLNNIAEQHTSPKNDNPKSDIVSSNNNCICF